MRWVRVFATLALIFAPVAGATLGLTQPALADGTVFYDSTVDFYFSGGAGASFVCSLDGSAPAPCSSPITYSGLSKGDHVFTVSQLADANNAAGTQATPFTIADRRLAPSAPPVAAAPAPAPSVAAPSPKPTAAKPSAPAVAAPPVSSPAAPDVSATPEPTPTPSDAPTESPSATPTPVVTLVPEIEQADPAVYDPNGTPEARAATVKSLTTGVVLAVSVAAAAASAAAGAKGGSSRGSSRGSHKHAQAASTTAGTGSSSAAQSSTPDFEQLDVGQDAITLSAMGAGDALAIASTAWFGALDRRSHQTVERVAPFSPLLAKIINDGAYLRAILGVFSLVPAVIALVLGAAHIGAHQVLAHGQVVLLPPQWLALLAITTLGVFDASAGLLGALAFAVGTVIWHFSVAGGVPSVGDVRLLGGVMLIGIAPGVIATTFRGIRRVHATGFDLLWERLIDLAVVPFMADWSVAGMVSGLSALAGLNLSIGNHATDFGVAIAVAMAARVLLEEAAARWFPARLNAINPDEIDEPSLVQRSVSLLLKFSVWMLLAAALMGLSWQVWAGAALAIFPAVVGWFSDRFPNSPWLWRILPQGLPALFVNLGIGVLTGLAVKAIVGDVPALAAWSSLIIPLPLLALSVAGMFGRHGNTTDDGTEEERFSKRNAWIYRAGGVVVLIAVLKLAGIF